MKPIKEQKQAWSEEFQEFLSTPEQAPPNSLSKRIAEQVHQDLNPSQMHVFNKLALIHAIIGSITLLFCPYSELYTFENFNVMHVLMKYGEQVCMLGCGTTYLGASMLAASFLLRPEEIQVLRKNRLLQISLLSFLSTTLSVCTGVLFFEKIGMVWAIGSILGGLLTLEMGWAFRSWYRCQNSSLPSPR